MAVWLPLESNPEVLNKYMYRLGVSPKWNIVDIYGLESEMLEWVPKPVKSVILLYPCSEANKDHRAKENDETKDASDKIPDNLFFMKQVTHNACGTIALVHSIANNKDVELEDGVLKKFLKAAESLTPDERAKCLENDTAVTDVHQELALEGQTSAPNLEDHVNHHFIAFVHKDGALYELDGRKSFPIRHGDTTEETLLQDAAKVCRQFMARDPNELRFTVIALTATAAQD